MLKPLLFLLFYLVLTPTALVRRLLSYDPMARKQWKCGTQSVFLHRAHRFTADDLRSPK